MCFWRKEEHSDRLISSYYDYGVDNLELQSQKGISRHTARQKA